MKLLTKATRPYFYSVAIGLWIMSFALFLHPMNPRDFLTLAVTAPLDTLRDIQGNFAAAVFWISLALIVTGLIGWIGSIRIHHPRHYHPV